MYRMIWALCSRFHKKSPSLQNPLQFQINRSFNVWVAVFAGEQRGSLKTSSNIILPLAPPPLVTKWKPRATGIIYQK